MAQPAEDEGRQSLRRVVYGDAVEGATFVPTCPHCGRFVTADATMLLDSNGLLDGPNATCEGPTGCGRVEMPFAGFL